MSTRRVESFLLRLVVQDDGCITPEQWRGRIQHIASGQELQIDQLQDVVAFIATHLGQLEMVSEQAMSPKRRIKY
ncbi:MAG: hypothetical protein MI924_01980 [Chloroflexales bacterium]|nr:hypothetical protein [Chloroflexales bacterium]